MTISKRLKQHIHKHKLAMMAVAAILSMSSGVAIAQVPEPPLSRTPQPPPAPEEYTRTVSPDGMTTYIGTPTGRFPESDPFINPTNLLPTIYENVKAADGNPIPNTLPSTPEQPYNLHPDPTVELINPTSPTDDLGEVFKSWHRVQQDNKGRGRGHGRGHGKNTYDPSNFDSAKIQRALDVLEGNPVLDLGTGDPRAYSGIPVLHYNGANKAKVVEPILDDEENVIGGNVTVHQVWYDSHIESDTSFLDPRPVADVPWTLTYVVDTLNKGHDDFSPSQIYFDDPKVFGKAVPGVMMDQTFFPMEEGTRTTYEIKMAPGRFYNLTYTWGWRRHPPRVAVMENSNKMAMGMSLVEWETSVFGDDPRASQAAKEAAIGMIGDLSPAKRMWNGLRRLQRTGFHPGVMAEIERAFVQWEQRNKLPDGVKPDPDADVTLFYANNTIYGQMKDYVIHDAEAVMDKWTTRGTTVKIKLINGDYFPHAYHAVDFGGLRGWENTFHNTIPINGAGPWFTFGRAYWQINTQMPVVVPAAESGERPYQGNYWRNKTRNHSQKKNYGKNKEFWQDELDPMGKELHKVFQRPTRRAHRGGDVLGEHNVELTLNYEPSRRIRIYQFDPLHHEQAIWSMH
jgi:hypothetical protein